MSVPPVPRVAAALCPQPRARDLALRQLPALALGALVVALLWDRVAAADAGGVAAALAGLAPGQWAAAVAFVAVSFWALGRYDALVHGWLGTGRGRVEAGRAGLVAIALSQTAGLGLLTGSLVRLRMLPGLGLAGALQVTLAVTGLFLAGLALLAALAVAIAAPPGLAALVPVAWAVLAALAVAVPLVVLRPGLTVFGRRLTPPPLPLLLRLLALAAVDMAAAGLCLWALLPGAAGVGAAASLPVFLAAFLVAFGAGMVSGAPGGMGAFEAVLLAALPQAGAEPLLAGVLAWRAVYHALPAVLALAALALGPGRAGRAEASPAALHPPFPSGFARLLDTAPRAEAGLVRQGEALLLEAGRGALCVLRTAQALVAPGDALGRACPDAARLALHRAARAEGRVPLLYKCGARAAAAARRAGWTVAAVAHEARLVPAAFSAGTPDRRQLRRKLRKAEAAGLALSRAPEGMPPVAEMAAVAHAWAAAHGGERGVTMGRFAPAYVAAQRVYLARAAARGGRLVAFLTLHRCRREWTLDLMRAHPEAPDGTMHALLALAIAEAAAEGCPRLSLAALPHPRIEAAFARLPCALAARLRPAALGEGLGQFKRAFAPSWETLYAAAPGPLSFALAAADLARAVAQPPPLPGGDPPAAAVETRHGAQPRGEAEAAS